MVLEPEFSVVVPYNLLSGGAITALTPLTAGTGDARCGA